MLKVVRIALSVVVFVVRVVKILEEVIYSKREERGSTAKRS
jgi:hypothetical protein